MTEEIQKEICKSCTSPLQGSYCSTCGRPKELQRINGSYIFSELSRVLNFDKGILYTIRELLLRPGLSIRKFILEDRNRLVKPVVFIFITSLIYTLLQQILRFEDGYIGFSNTEESASVKIFKWISENYGYANVLMAVFIGLWLKLFFRRYKFNFFEILILLCFMMGMGMLFFSIFGIIQGITQYSVLDIGSVIAVLYISWGIGQFFDKTKKMNYVKAFFSYILGMFTFSIFALAIGFFIDFVNKTA